MICKQKTTYACWPSPIKSQVVTAQSIGLTELRLHQSAAFWLETRPEEKGRNVIVCHKNGKSTDLLPAPFSARSRVHEYGGGAYCVTDEGIYFVNDKDQDIYHITDSGQPHNITNTNNLRFADMQFDSRSDRIICVCEQHSSQTSQVFNTLVSIAIDTGSITTLAEGYDFYASPRLSHDGNHLSWLCWNHPNMPWDGTELWLAELLDPLQPTKQKRIAGSETVSIFQPAWSPDNILYFISDQSGWWNLYRHHNNKIQQLTNESLEFGRPQWIFSQSTYTFISSSEILCNVIDNGIGKLLILDTDECKITLVDTAWTSFSSIQSHKDQLWFIAASEKQFPQIVNMQCHSYDYQLVKSSCHTAITSDYFSFGQVVAYKTRHNDEAYAIYYPPTNPDIEADSTQVPPLIVLTHGGPTTMCEASLDLRKQFWTSRGFALLDVNYGGSTGYGRNYRKRLEGNWGLRDATDCCDAALHMVQQGLADAERLIIKGGSAGGFTVLCALAFHDVFSAGASYYGIGELETLVTDTHKFESRYLDKLIGPYPEAINIYHQRSPLLHVEQFNCPVIFFQGDEDKVVPAEQAEKMHAALKAKGIPVSYVLFKGEQHGFRKAETIQATLDLELAFYSKIFKLDVPDTVKINIDNIN